MTSVLGATLAFAGFEPDLPATAALDPPAPTVAGPIADPSATTTVTLVTGDRVQVRRTADGTWGVGQIVAAEREDARPVAFHTLATKGHVYVIPSDAVDALATDRVDIALFDVASLADDGYVDGRDDAVPVIIQYADHSSVRTLASRSNRLPGTTPGPTLESIDAQAVEVATDAAASFWTAVTDQPTGAARTPAAVEKVWLDQRIEVTLEDSVPQVGAPEAWAAGYDGTGVTVGVLDTGVDADHPDLADAIAGSQSFVPGQQVADGHGHGTHVAATIAGSGAASDGARRGVAPGAQLLVGKVLNNSGGGGLSWIVDGMEWAAGQGADVISMSLGGNPTDGTDPMSQAVDALSAGDGPLFVIAAGNDGPSTGTVSTPGAAQSALTVAAVDKSDAMANFSSRGPRIGDLGLKPDIAAPGVAIGAARAAGTTLGAPIDEFYTRASGTSMATPHVAGAAAILAQQHSDWTGAQLKDALTTSAADVGAGPFEQGSGRLDVARAVSQEVIADDSVMFGHLPYPATEPVTRTITYTNPTDTALTLNLSAQLSSYGGGSVPDGVLNLDRDQISVPAGGTAQVAATIDASSGEVRGLLTGFLTATDAAGTRLRTRLGVFVEPRSHDLTVEAVAPNEATEVETGGWLIIRNDGWIDFASNSVRLPGELTATTRLPEGSYTVAAAVDWRDASGELNQALVLDPDVDVTATTTAQFDLADARLVAADAPGDTERFSSSVAFMRTSADASWTLSGDLAAGYDTHRIRMLLTQPVESGAFEFASNHVLGAPLVSMHVEGRDRLDLRARYQSPNVQVPKLQTRRNLQLVDGGAGLPDDLAGLGVEGKLVLLRPTDVCTEACPAEAVDRVANAAASGAAGVLLAGIEGRVDLGAHTYPIPTLSVPTDVADTLVERLDGRGRVSVEIDGEPDVPRAYVLYFPEQGGLPSDLTYRVDNDQLARVDHRLHADAGQPAQPRWITFDGSHPANADLVTAATTPVVQAPRVLRVYSGPRATAISTRMLLIGPPDDGGSVRETAFATFDRRSYQLDWEAGPIVPGPAASEGATAADPDNTVPSFLCSGCRADNTFLPFMALSRDAAHFVGYTGALEGGVFVPPGHFCRPDDPDHPPNHPPRWLCDIHLYDEDGNEIEPTIVDDGAYLPDPFGQALEEASR